MLSAKEQIACEDHLLDPFVENFVLEIKVPSRGGEVEGNEMEEGQCIMHPRENYAPIPKMDFSNP
ncbi:hypothetical protein Pyn_37876 [Prunus yedoensis var. nudiflora]|uniref:Uncharacterized protein n=1 Tax=Prunus yedoensis var. nudiflora TaxID=2094558 RepID=A0A314XQ14_PRUYE|nr:hypothetical protein Pyn_37876 [Prunus yedoensis var. nudiflora]